VKQKCGKRKLSTVEFKVCAKPGCCKQQGLKQNSAPGFASERHLAPASNKNFAEPPYDPRPEGKGQNTNACYVCVFFPWLMLFDGVTALPSLVDERPPPTVPASGWAFEPNPPRVFWIMSLTFPAEDSFGRFPPSRRGHEGDLHLP